MIISTLAKPNKKIMINKTDIVYYNILRPSVEKYMKENKNNSKLNHHGITARKNYKLPLGYFP